MTSTSGTSLPAPSTSPPLYGQIRNALRAQILDGHYAPGSRVPSESELGSRFKASRITVRQALADLQKEGLIYTLHGKGSFVSRPKAFQNVSKLQGFAEQMSGLGYDVLNQVLGLRDVPADTQVAARLGLQAGDTVTEIKRVRLLNREPVSLELTWVPQAIGKRLAQADLVTRDIFLILENDCALPLGHADLALDAVLADEATAEALRVPVGSPLLRIERLTHDSQGTPLDYEFLYFRGDTFQYRFRVDRQRAQEAHSANH